MGTEFYWTHSTARAFLKPHLDKIFFAALIIVLRSSAAPGQAISIPENNISAKNPAVVIQKDVTDAIQLAIDRHDSYIAIEPGRHRITRPIVIDLQQTGVVSISGNGVATIVMDGPGPAFRFIGTHKGTAAPRSFESTVWERQRAPMIDGIEIVGMHPEACGIEADGTMQLTITRLIIRHALHAIHLKNLNRNILVADSHLYDNHGIGLYLDNVDLHQINVNNCHISYNRQGGIVSQRGNVRNLHINGCDIESNMSPESLPTANVLIDCSNSTFGTAEVAINGCTIQHNSKSKDSANIRMIGKGISKIDSQESRWGNVTITGNVLSDVSHNVHLKECRGVTLQGNTLWMGYEHNLLVESCSNVVVGPNNLDRNPRYDYGDASQSKNGVVFRDCVDCTITGLHVSNVHSDLAAMVFDNCRRLNVSACTILDSDGPGLLLRNVSQSLITSCLIGDDSNAQQASVSLRIEGGKGNQLSNNVLSNGSETIQ